jgi:hypothetical protein
MNVIRRSIPGPRLGVLFALALAFSLHLQGAAAGGLPLSHLLT